MAHDTYLTADYKVDVKNNNIDDYSREGCKAGKDVNLATTEISSWRQVCGLSLHTKKVRWKERRPRITSHSKSREMRNSQLEV